MLKKIVIKIGTNILTTPEGSLDLNNLRSLVDQISRLQEKHRCLIVTSAAITCGSEKLKLQPQTLPEKQAAAAVGQPLLMMEYERFFSHHGHIIGQILFTKDVLDHPQRMHAAHDTINTLIEKSAIPIFNENDSISVDEIKFGDNDELSSLIALLAKADLYIILTDIDGLYTKNPKQHTDATQIFEVHNLDDQYLAMASGPLSTRSKGGMISKLKAAQLATENGITTVIANGRKAGILEDILEGKKIGTLFHAKL